MAKKITLFGFQLQKDGLIYAGSDHNSGQFLVWK
jgi:hypothetical protein